MNIFSLWLFMACYRTSGIRSEEFEARRAQAISTWQPCNFFSATSFKRYRFQLHAQRYPGYNVTVALQLVRSRKAPKLSIYWQHDWKVAFDVKKDTLDWTLVPTSQGHGTYEVDLLDVSSIAYSENEEPCLEIRHKNGTWQRLCGGAFLLDFFMKPAMRVFPAPQVPIPVRATEALAQSLGPSGEQKAMGFADGSFGRGALRDVVGIRSVSSTVQDASSQSRKGLLSMSKKIFEKLRCHPKFRECPTENGVERLVPKTAACSTEVAPKPDKTPAFPLPEDNKGMAVKVECDDWMRRVTVGLLSGKGRSAILYQYHSSDVGEGVSRVLKMPRTEGLEAVLVDEAKQVSILQNIGLNVPACNYCNVTFMGTDTKQHTSTCLVKEKVHGFDLADIVAALGDGKFDVRCLPERDHAVDVEAVIQMAGHETLAERLRKTMSTTWSSRAETLTSRIRRELRCIFARFALDLLSNSPGGIFLDLSARNLMWATLREEDREVPETYKLWVVDSMPILPGSREFHSTLANGPHSAWDSRYATPWNFGPGLCSHTLWKKFRIPRDPKVVVREWLPACRDISG
eukprot:TRINITY_DN16559_c0_g1_i1.p1 TRINITY_DN16559_c0_g1~~TRINITY_DN16559_c0_g1_i1.p1  ORF type:complete len:572 (+),score=86.27 TRINITY_DN16559_c0_g1_i1:51-1766(+)